MTAEHLIAFNIFLFVSMLSPGPALLMVARQTLEQGFSVGFKTGIGLGTMAAFWTMCALIGLGAAFALFPFAYSAVRLIGALVLLYFAYSIWKSASQIAKARPILFSNPIVLGLITNAMNPKSILFASSVLLAIFPQNMTIFEDGLIVANHFGVEVIFYAGLTFILSRKGIAEVYLQAKSIIDRIFAGLLAALSLFILWEVLIH